MRRTSLVLAGPVRVTSGIIEKTNIQGKQMVLAPDVRKQKLTELKKTGPSQGKQKLYYQGTTQTFDSYRIDLDWLIYNRHNGRLEAEMLTWEQENSVSPELYDDELHDLIDDLLWKSNVSANKYTLEDLKDKQQQRPGIVSLDGVIIDGNRRAMLLRRLEKDKQTKQYLDAIILPHAYNENQKEIVRLETQYQLGEDSKVEYGPLQKYLHARRLRTDLGIEESEIDKLMGQSEGYTKRLLDTMTLMDDYLEHIGCPKLYTMLKDSDGTKEGMFVDLQGDLRRLQSGNAKVPWAFDPEVDLLQLKLIQFDYMRMGEFADAKKSYREISHQGKSRNFFCHKDIWEGFATKHGDKVDAATMQMGSLEEFIEANPGHESKVEAARARDDVWREKVKASMKENFGKSSEKLYFRVSELAPHDYLERALLSIEKVDIESAGFLSDPENEKLVREINRRSFEMKKKFERASN